jgi:hypothetical protein
MTRPLSTSRLRARAQDGFTMIIAVGVMFVTALLLIAAFTVTNGDVHLSRADTSQKQAYYAALAGVQQYEHFLQSNPDYWQKCESPTSTVPEEPTEKFEVTPLVASSAPEGTKECQVASPFTSMIESKGPLANTFRIKSVGTAAKEKRSVVATFQVTGFLNYLFFTNFETVDPTLYPKSNKAAAEECRGKYYSEWSSKGSEFCETIFYLTGDKIEGPLHTNDAAQIGGSAVFGREGHVPSDSIEFNGGSVPAGCPGSATYNTATKCYTKGVTLLPPESDTSLEAYVEPENEFTGLTYLELIGSKNEIKVTNFLEGKKTEKTIKWPKNGLIYVKGSGGNCEFEVENSDTAAEFEKIKNCGDVVVHGTYKESITVAGENDVIVNGSIYPTSVEGKLGSVPTGTAVLGLIASRYVRVYHPVSTGGTREINECTASNLSAGEDPNGFGVAKDPYVYAAILSTSHSWLVDNASCGEGLGELHIYGALAQNYRGIVYRGGHGYIKNYKYDDRVATDEPPYFLAPLKAGWSVIRETAPGPG